MADPVRGDLALWSYIQSVYNQINTGRSKFSLGSNIAIPSNPGQITTRDISSIKAQIDLFNNNAYVRSDSNAQTAINSIRVPTQGTLIQPLPLSATMDAINNVCIHNATYRGSYHSSNCNNSYNSSGYNSSGYNSSGYNSSNNSYRSSGYNSSGYRSSYRSSYNSSDHSYRSSYRSSYHSSNYTYRSGYKRTR